MNEPNMIYEMMEINSANLVVPEKYQRKLNSSRVDRIVANFDERIANEPKVSYRDGKYNMFDGQHTSVARKRMNGGKDLMILCKVYRNLTEDEENQIMEILMNHDTEGCSIRGTRKEIAEEIGG